MSCFQPKPDMLTSIRLRDVSSETERDHKAKLSELEKEVSAHEGLISEFSCDRPWDPEADCAQAGTSYPKPN